jgi:hypothetical protein
MQTASNQASNASKGKQRKEEDNGDASATTVRGWRTNAKEGKGQGRHPT